MQLPPQSNYSADLCEQLRFVTPKRQRWPPYLDNSSFDILDLEDVNYIPSSKAIPIGLTVGERHYKVKGKGWKKYHYIDAQAWMGFGGMGLGIMVDESRNNYLRFKCGGGLLGYLTYDNFKVFKHNFGLIGVLPILNPEC